MDPHSTPGPSSLTYYPALSPSYNELDDLAPRLQVRIPLGNIQSNRSEEGLNTRGSSFQCHLSPLSGFERLSILHPVQNMHNDQSLLFDSLLLLSEGLSLTHAGWRGANRQMEQADSEIEYHNALSPPRDIDGVSGLSAPPASLVSTTTAGTLPSLSAELYAQSGAQDNHNAATFFSRGQVESTTPSPMATQGRSSSTQRQTRKMKDMGRKRVQRLDDEQPFARICELLEIPLVPEETLVRRILVGVETLVEQLKLDCDLRRQLVTGEADITAKRAQLSAEADTCAHDGSNTGATLRSFNGELDKRHN